MTLSRTGRGVAVVAWLGVLALVLGGAGCGAPKAGDPPNVKDYTIEVEVDPALKQGSVLVDLVGVTMSSLPRWESQSMSQYWVPGNTVRKDAERDRITLDFLSGENLKQSLGRTNGIWKRWMSQNVTHVLVLARLPDPHEDRPGTTDPRRQILPLDKNYWPKASIFKRTKVLKVQVRRAGIDVITPSRGTSY